MIKILVVEDERAISDLIRMNLEDAGYACTCVYDGMAAADQIETQTFDLVLLDIMLPKVNGYELLEYIKPTGTPVIFLTAKAGLDDRVRGLNLGAEDYIVKPFSPSEVMARLRAVLRRISRQSVETQSGQILRVSNMEVNLDEYTFCIDGKKIPMTKKEIETMWTLASTPGKVFTRDNLLDSLWGYDYYGDSRTVDSHIKRLRAKLDSVPHPDWTIKTIWGVGYKLEIAGGQ